MPFLTLLHLNAMVAGCLMLSATGDGAIDYADGAQRECWFRHPVLGDPSFDTFEHAPNNPVHRGAPPYEWPVNGFLFEDPVSGHWFVYAGLYLKGYAMDPENPSMCIVYRSTDAGKSWEHLGPVFDDQSFLFDGETFPTRGAPDVQVTYAEGRYHLCFDWCTANTTWQNAANPPPDANSGVGYAWSDRPEGPYTRHPRPIATTRGQEALLGKYRRLYASSIIRRAKDWLVLTLTDSGPWFGWALVGMTADKPEGPYSKPLLLLHPEVDRFHPPLLEFFPAFTHEGHVFAPTTSVALNRNYQGVFRAPLEQAMDPSAWELWQHGSVWHAEPVENEYHGLWGQTFGGGVADGILRVMFPSRDKDGLGTINVAARPWDKPYRDRGFALSGHQGPSLALLKVGGPANRFELECERHGTAALVWNHAGPLGPNEPRSDATLHPLVMTRYSALELDDAGWRLVEVDAAGERRVLAQGERAGAVPVSAAITWTSKDEAALILDGGPVWAGALSMGSGGIGLFVGAQSHARIARFVVDGAAAPARISFLYTEGLLCAAQNRAHWEERSDASQFRFGIGAISKEPGLDVKWNVEGHSFTVWAPKGPEFGSAEVFLDGVRIGAIDFSAPEPIASAPVLTREGLDGPYHALRLHVAAGRMPVDSLDVAQ